MMNLISFISSIYIFKGGNVTEMIFFCFFNIGFFSDIYRLISFKLGMMIETTSLYIVVPVWITLTFIEKNVLFFSHKFGHG